ncbi:DUF4232 domain-containing protein [Paludibaculum fermentans]|uniref:DUF4232 domain-containing protein n=1 Tax=Paludibaculum fermentans TaxID=1473598 RepID=UPI003EBB5617
MRICVAHLICASLTFANGPPFIPGCTDNQLSATSSGGSAMGNTYRRVTLTNVSSIECRLAGPPRVEQYDKHGRRTKTAPEWPANSLAAGEGARSLALAPARWAVFEIHTLSSTGYDPGRNCGVRLAILLPQSRKSVITFPVESCGPVRISGYLPGP